MTQCEIEQVVGIDKFSTKGQLPSLFLDHRIGKLGGGFQAIKCKSHVLIPSEFRGTQTEIQTKQVISNIIDGVSIGGDHPHL